MGRGQTNTQTHTQTHRHRDNYTELAQWADSVKSIKNKELTMQQKYGTL